MTGGVVKQPKFMVVCNKPHVPMSIGINVKDAVGRQLPTLLSAAEREETIAVVKRQSVPRAYPDQSISILGDTGNAV